MKLNRFFALVLTLCMLFSLAQFPVSAEEIYFEASGSLSSAASPLYTYSSQEEINLEEYYIKDVALPSSPTIKSTEYYANSLTADQKQYYRAIMDGFTGISDSSLRLKQAVCVTYSKKYSVTISTQAQLQVFLNNKLNTEMNGLDIQTIYNAIQYDHTELFWMRGMFCTVAADASSDGTSTTVNYYVYFLVDSSDLFASDSALRTAAKAMTSQVSSIISNTPETNEYDKLVYFNKWLKENNTYNNTHLENNNYPLAHTAYSAFTSNSDEPTGPVCQGYAYALKYLCDKAGIHSVIVTGDLCQTGSAPGPHAWNAVELDGNWYAIDTTANDSLGTDVYNFLAGSATPSHDSGYPTFSASHVVDDIHTYPTLSTTAYEPPAPVYEYTILDGEVSILGYNGTATEIEIPKALEGYPVTSIAPEAFSGSTLTSIVIPDSVKIIGDKAFYNCDNLVTLKLGNGVTTIGYQSISDCDKLTTITITDKVSSIDPTAFYNSSLTSISASYSNNYFTSEAGVLYNKKKNEIVKYPEGKTLETVTISASITGIGPYAFSNFTNIKNLVTYDELKTIDEYAFYGCVNLKNIAFGNAVTTIASRAFADCSSLTKITLPSTIKTIESYAFSGCNSLTTVDYKGTEATRENIEIGSNSELTDATWNYLGCRHEYKNSCDADCDICGEIRTIAHFYKNDCDTDCDICGFTRETEHVYDNDSDTDCNECGEERIIIVRLPGDVNGDGFVNNKDFGILRQYLNNWEVTINESNADVNADGFVNNKDMGILRQYLNNWDVELL